MNTDEIYKQRWLNIEESLIPKDEHCVLRNMCKYKTGGCVVLPDDGCPVYRWFKELINKEPRPE